MGRKYPAVAGLAAALVLTLSFQVQAQVISNLLETQFEVGDGPPEVVYVGTSEGEPSFDKISEAIAAVAEGGTVIVGEDFTGAGETITIDKDVTLRAAEGELPTISDAINVLAGDVTIEGLGIRRTGTNPSYAIRVAEDSGNIVIRNNVIEASVSAILVLAGDVTVEGNTILPNGNPEWWGILVGRYTDTVEAHAILNDNHVRGFQYGIYIRTLGTVTVDDLSLIPSPENAWALGQALENQADSNQVDVWIGDPEEQDVKWYPLEQKLQLEWITEPQGTFAAGEGVDLAFSAAPLETGGDPITGAAFVIRCWTGGEPVSQETLDITGFSYSEEGKWKREAPDIAAEIMVEATMNFGVPGNYSLQLYAIQE